MIIRKAGYDDLVRIMEVCEQARGIMRSDGNLDQWTGGYPSEEVICNDIRSGVAYVVDDITGVIGYFAFIPGVEKTYLRIDDGQWLDDSLPYATIHRMASTPDSHDVAATCFDWCWNQVHNLRIDTHRDNRIMQHCIRKFGFQYCGIIYLENGDERLAYQKIEK